VCLAACAAFAAALCGAAPAADALPESPVFVLAGPEMLFLVGGGDSPDTYVALCTRCRGEAHQKAL
jgi:hypothetical protein